MLQVTTEQMMDKATEVDEARDEVITLSQEVQTIEEESSRTSESRIGVSAQILFCLDQIVRC